MKHFKLLSFFFVLSIATNAQVVYEHISNTAIYDFLDELANNKVIMLQSVVKPYSKVFIAEKLLEADGKRDMLSARQEKELDFYLHGYRMEVNEFGVGQDWGDLFKKHETFGTSLNPLAFLYKDSVFTMSIKPIWGVQYFFNEHGTVFHRWGGAEAYAYVGKRLSFYASLRDNRESEWLSAPEYLNQRLGVPVKGVKDGGVDFSEMRGGIFYAWKWGHVGIVKDHNAWGNNYNGPNIISAKPASYGMIKLHLKPARWFEFNWFHGWLVSEVVDSSRSYYSDDGTYREVFHPKYMAANMFTFTPWRGLDLSVGNSIVYSDIGVQAVYLVPVLFYKSVDHTLNSTANNTGQNSQMFLDLSSRNIKHLHLYFTMFIDELKVDRITDADEYNFISYKGGFRLSDWPLQDVALTGEYTRTNPLTYQHHISTTTFETNNYNMGHYLRDNAEEIYLALTWKPVRGLLLKGSYLYARKGNNYIYGVTEDPTRQPILKDITWDDQTLAFTARYEFLNNTYVFTHLILSNIQGYDVDDVTAQEYLETYTPELFWGQKTTFSVGFNFGF